LYIAGAVSYCNSVDVWTKNIAMIADTFNCHDYSHFMTHAVLSRL